MEALVLVNNSTNVKPIGIALVSNWILHGFFCANEEKIKRRVCVLRQIRIVNLMGVTIDTVVTGNT